VERNILAASKNSISAAVSNISILRLASMIHAGGKTIAKNLRGRGIHSIGNQIPVVKLSKIPRVVARFAAAFQVFDIREIKDPMLMLIKAPQTMKTSARRCAGLKGLKTIQAPITGDVPARISMNADINSIMS